MLSAVLVLGLTAPPAAGEVQSNALVAFISEAGHVVVRELDGQRQRTVYEAAASSPRAFRSLAFSPDARQLAFVDAPPQQQTTLRVVAAGEDHATVVASVADSDDIRNLGWSADGDRIAYTHQSSQGYRVMVVAADGTSAAREVPGQISLGWQPVAGSTRLAVVGDGVRLVDVDTLEMSEPMAEGISGSWSPLGDQLAVAGRPQFESPLVVVDVRTGEQRTLADYVSHPSFSPDGRHVAVWSRPETNIGADSELLLIDVETGEQRTVLREGSAPYYAHLEWTPDGQRIVYNRMGFRTGEGDITVVDLSNDRAPVVDWTDGEVHDFAAAPTFREDWLAGASPQPRSIGNACPAATPEDGYEDVADNNPHEFAIDCVAWWKVAQGTTATTYSPGTTVNRAQMASFLARLIRESGGELPPPSRDYFTDDDQSVHETAINRLAEAGIVSGGGDGRYRPGREVTRAQMATFLVNTTNWRSDPELVSSHDYFDDDNGNAHEPAINAAAEVGLTGGTADGGYNPAGDVRRDQMASFLARVLDLLVERGDAAHP